MKILVSGSNGFIGKKLVKELKQIGHQVFGFDRSNEQDILNFEQVKRAVKEMDVVFHLAASLREDDPMLFKVNVNGTKNLLEASAASQIKHFIFLSTVGVMGEVKGIADEKTTFNPQTPYEKSKAKAEELVLTYQEVLPVTVVRSALVLGANKQWKQIIKMVKRGFPLIGSGKNFWQIIYIEDLVSALAFLMDKEDAIGETFIVAEKNPKMLIELVELIRRELWVKEDLKKIPVWLAMFLGTLIGLHPALKKKYSLLDTNYIKRLIRNRHYSIEKIKKLGWQPKYFTEQAVRVTVKEIGL